MANSIWSLFIRIVLLIVSILSFSIIPDLQFPAAVHAEFILERHLGDQTPYYSQQNASDYTDPPEGCVAIHATLLARHGARYGSFSDLSKLVQWINENKRFIPAQWILNYNPLREIPWKYSTEQLADLGVWEHYQLAQRFQKLWPHLFGIDQSFDPIFFRTRSTDYSRTGMSGFSFLQGLWETQQLQLQQLGRLPPLPFQPFFIPSERKDTDGVLQFHSVCPRYVREVDDNDTATEEVEKWLDHILPNIAEKIKQKINPSLPPGFNFEEDAVPWVWSACQSDVVVQQDDRFWCSLLDVDDIINLEYAEDLESYYEDGHGHRVNYESATLLLQNLFSNLESVIAATRENRSSVAPVQRAYFIFAHATDIASLLALMGFYRDAELLRAIETHRDNHKWRLNELAPFAANILWILYHCNNEQQPDEYRLEMFHNEKEMLIGGSCGNQLFCPVETVKKTFQPQLSLSFEEVCDLPQKQFCVPVSPQ